MRRVNVLSEDQAAFSRSGNRDPGRPFGVVAVVHRLRDLVFNLLRLIETTFYPTLQSLAATKLSMSITHRRCMAWALGGVIMADDMEKKGQQGGQFGQGQQSEQSGQQGQNQQSGQPGQQQPKKGGQSQPNNNEEEDQNRDRQRRAS